MMESRNHGVPLLQHAPRSKVQQSIAGLAHALCDKDPKSNAKEKDKAGRWALFSRK
jgi:Flp pilus assembly CpaE family ATPase